MDLGHQLIWYHKWGNTHWICVIVGLALIGLTIWSVRSARRKLNKKGEWL